MADDNTQQQKSPIPGYTWANVPAQKPATTNASPSPIPGFKWAVSPEQQDRSAVPTEQEAAANPPLAPLNLPGMQKVSPAFDLSDVKNDTPVQNPVTTGKPPIQEIGEDIARGDISKGINKTVSTAAGAYAPLAIPAAVEAPIATLLAAGSGGAAQYGGEKLGETFGLSPEQSEVAGNVAGIATGMGAGRLGNIGGKVLAGQYSPEDIVGLFKKALYPGTIGATEVPDLQGEVNAAMKHVGQYTSPRGGAPIEKGPGAVNRVMDILHQAGDNLWNEQVQPLEDNYGHIMRPTGAVQAQVSASIPQAELDIMRANPDATISPRVRAVQERANLYGDDRPMTVKQISDRVTELNSDKAVARFYTMNPNEQTQALAADPALKAKVVEGNALRDLLIKTIGEEGGEANGAKYQQARTEFGQLRNLENRVADRAKLDTGSPLRTRTAVGSSSHLITYPFETLANYLNNPERALPTALNRIGTNFLPERGELPGRMEPYTPPNRMLPAAGGTTEGHETLFSGEQGPQGRPGPATARPPIEAPGSTTERQYFDPNATSNQPLASSPQGITAIQKAPDETPTTHIRSGREQAPIKGVGGGTGAAPTSPKVPTGPIRRGAGPGGLRDIQGPSIEKSAIMNNAQRILSDPAATARDKAIATSQLADMRANRFDMNEFLRKDPIEIYTDKNGTTWARNKTISPNDISIPKNMPHSKIETYAREQLAKQATMANDLKARVKSTEKR